MNQPIVDYLNQNKNNYSQEALIQQLKANGYPEKDIDQAVTYVYGVYSQRVDQQQPANQSAYQQTQNQAQQQPYAFTSYAGFWIRFLALFIDGIILAVVNGIISAVLLGIGGSGGMGSLEAIVQILNWIIPMGYHIFMLNQYQATLGKMALGLKVFAGDGNQLSLGRIILRETVGRIACMLTFGIGYIMAGFTQRKQGLHDMISDSVVLRVK